MHTCMHACVCACMCVCMHVCVHACMHASVHACVYTILSSDSYTSMEVYALAVDSIYRGFLTFATTQTEEGLEVRITVFLFI